MDKIDCLGIGLLIGLIVGCLLFGISYYDSVDDIEELGQSICEEEYNLDFESYIDEVLKCKPLTNYDGIRVEINS